MRLLVIFGCFLLFIIACKSKNKVPQDILPKQQMQEVLWDLLRAGEMLEVYRLPKDSLADKRSIAQGWYDEVFRLHKTDRESFQKSYTWYQRHPQLMKDMVDSIANKKIPDYRPPGQATVDSAAIKKDSTVRMDSALRAAADSVKKPLIKTGRRPDDTLGIKKNDIRSKKDTANFLQSPLLQRKKMRLDSLRRAREKKLPD